MTNFADILEKSEGLALKLLWSLTCLLTLLSLVIIFTIGVESIEAIKSNGTDFSSSGYVRFIDYFLPFKELLSSNVGILGLYIIVRQVQIMASGNKISNWSSWREKFEERLRAEIGSSHRTMFRHLEVNGQEMHEFLFKSNMVIRDKEHLNEFFAKFIKIGIPSFEQRTSEYISDSIANTLYQNITSYSYLNYFSKVSELIARPSIFYPDLTTDLKEMYLNEVNNSR
jgi:hypothetical protein